MRRSATRGRVSITVAAAVILAGCTSAPSDAPTTGSAPPTAAAYDVTLEVAYREWVRRPGVGHIPREIDVTYSIDEQMAVGEWRDADAHGTVTWAVRCFDPAVFDPEAVPTAEDGGTIDFAPAGDASEYTDPENLELEVDWSAGTGVMLLEVDGAFWVAHRLPSGIALDHLVDVECRRPFSAVALTWGHGAMTAPGRVNVGGTDFSRAESMNRDQDPPVYVLDPAGDGWLLAVIATDDLATGPQPIQFAREIEDAEFGVRLTVTGTISPRS